MSDWWRGYWTGIWAMAIAWALVAHCSPAEADTTELACELPAILWGPAPGSYDKYQIAVQWPAPVGGSLAPFKTVAMSSYACFGLTRGRLRARFKAMGSMRVRVRAILKGGEVGEWSTTSEWMWWKDVAKAEEAGR